jgi:nitrite reductase/ring-hydroxylating ferredoxin subunit
MLVVGDLDHKTGQADDGDTRLTKIQEWIKQHYPSSGEVLYSWSGQIGNAAGGLAFIGREKNNLYVATGFSGNGMTYGTISGILIRDLILGKENAWAKIYDPRRKVVGGAKQFVVLSEKGAKKVIGSMVEGERAGELECGSGIVADQGLAGRTTVYKDEKGEVHSSSAACRHMGCPVAWNSTERTFDCPCHGSRYTGFGKVVNGPANTNLKEA